MFINNIIRNYIMVIWRINTKKLVQNLKYVPEHLNMEQGKLQEACYLKNIKRYYQIHKKNGEGYVIKRRIYRSNIKRFGK